VQEALPQNLNGAGEFEGGDFASPTRPELEEDPLGFEFVEETTPVPGFLHILWRRFGFLLVTLVVLGLMGLWAWQRRLRGAKPIPVVVERELTRRGWNVPVWLGSLANWSELTTIERLYISYRWLIWIMGGELVEGQTPAERMADLRELIPTAREHANLFLESYQYAVYSQHFIDLKPAEHSGWQLWKTGLRERARKILGV
jgi:hypothetical protein